MMISLGLGGIWFYLCCVFVYGEAVIGAPSGRAKTAAIILVGLVVIRVGVERLLRRRPKLTPVAVRIGFSAIVIAATVVATDIAVSMLANWSARSGVTATDPELRRDDPRIWHGELYPEHFFPTDRAFSLFKPDVVLTGSTYGEFYHPDMLQSSTLADSVLELKTLTYRIGPLGMRDTTPISDARIYALGDSFAMGYGTDEGLTWTERLGESMGEPVYNMGVSATGPNTQRMLLDYILESQENEIRVEHLLWMLFEGNDLENGFGEFRHRPTGSGLAQLAEGTLLGSLLTIPDVVKESSVLRRAIDGTLRRPAALGAGSGAEYVADGIPSRTPLYHSKRFGLRLFSPDDVERSRKPLRYVLDHPHWPLMQATFEKMRQLSEQKGFRVTVVLAPSAARLYGAAFEDCPNPTSEPHLINELAKLARKTGFDVIDLFVAMRPHAEKELLYYRDDHHWNARGNALAAEIIREAMVR